MHPDPNILKADSIRPWWSVRSLLLATLALLLLLFLAVMFVPV